MCTSQEEKGLSFYEEEIGLSSVSPESPPLFNINAEEEIGWTLMFIYWHWKGGRSSMVMLSYIYVLIIIFIKPDEIYYFIQNSIVDDVMMNYSFSCKFQVLMILGGVNY